MTKSRQTEVFALNDLPDGMMKSVRVGQRTLLFARRGNAVFAVRDVCPHQGAPLSSGVLTCARKTSKVGSYEADQEGAIVRCPWHNWEIDVIHGTVRHDPDRTRVATYTVSVQEGRVFVEI